MGASKFDTTRIMIGVVISQTFYALIVQVQGDIPRMGDGISGSHFNETVKPAWNSLTHLLQSPLPGTLP